MYPDPVTTRPHPQTMGDQSPDSSSRGLLSRHVAGSSWLTVLAFAIVAVPFAIILIRFLVASGQHVYLPDDLALIDFHTREALRWKQQLGVFDHNNWNHPGPSYFYLLSLFYRLLGSGAKAMFFGATLINALSAIGCVEVVRRRSTPARALWAAVWVCLLAVLLATVGPGSITYSEGAIGALVSPWNPMVVIFPLLLFVLLCAAAMDRSPLSLMAALLVGSFIIQTNISALPLVAALFAVSGATWTVTLVVDRTRTPSVPTDGSDVPATSDDRSAHRRRLAPSWRVWALASAGFVVFAVMWLPPVIQQFTNDPGNFTLIERFFTAGHPGQSFKAGLWSVAAVFGVLVEGPSEIMSSFLGSTPHHAAVAVVVSVAVILVGVAVTVIGLRQRRRFAAGLGALTLVGYVAMVLAVTHVVGWVYGYLVIWAIVIPLAALISVGLVRFPLWAWVIDRRPFTSTTVVRTVLCGIGVVLCVVLGTRVVAIPALSTVSNPHVASMYSLVSPALDPHGTVFVGDNGAGSATTGLFDTEEFIGLVNRLDQYGYHPKVNHLWKVQFGPGYLTSGHEGRQIQLYTWTPASPAMPGYVGRVGDIAVIVTGANSQPVTH